MLVINQDKVVVIPLWTRAAPRQKPLWLLNSPWKAVKFSNKGKYLGIFLGPGATALDSFQGALGKLATREVKWKKANFSLFNKLESWNIYMATLTSYVDQLYVQPSEVTECLFATLKRFAGGVNGWIDVHGLGLLDQWHNFPIAARMPHLSNWAAIARCWLSLPSSTRGDYSRRLKNIPGLSKDNFDGSPLANMKYAMDNYKRLWKIEPRDILNDLTTALCAKKPELGHSQARRASCKQLQKTLYSSLKSSLLKVRHDGSLVKTTHPLEFVVSRWRKYFWRDHKHLARSSRPVEQQL